MSRVCCLTSWKSALPNAISCNCCSTADLIVGRTKSTSICNMHMATITNMCRDHTNTFTVFHILGNNYSQMTPSQGSQKQDNQKMLTILRPSRIVQACDIVLVSNNAETIMTFKTSEMLQTRS